MDWQPIKTAPRDGTRIRVRRDMGESFGMVTGTAYWYGSGAISGWIARGDGVFGELGLAQPTEWKPLEVATTQAAAQGWQWLSRNNKPVPDALVAVIWRRGLRYGFTRLSADPRNPGLLIDSALNDYVWNVDRDPPDQLPTHFMELPTPPADARLRERPIPQQIVRWTDPNQRPGR